MGFFLKTIYSAMKSLCKKKNYMSPNFNVIEFYFFSSQNIWFFMRFHPCLIPWNNIFFEWNSFFQELEIFEKRNRRSINREGIDIDYSYLVWKCKFQFYTTLKSDERKINLPGFFTSWKKNFKAVWAVAWKSYWM